MSIKELIKTTRLYFDGGTGTVLSARGLDAGKAPEIWNLERPEEIIRLHREYIDAGANIIKANTFGINADKYTNYAEMIKAAMNCAKTAAKGNDSVFVAYDMGPTGRLLKPLGDIDFEDAVELFAKNVREAVKNGADLILIETMNCSYETKAAVLAAKENSDLPIFVTNVYGTDGRLLTGATPEVMAAMLEGLGVDALGINCSLGPDKMLPIVERLADATSLPIIVNPNAGLPKTVDGQTVFETDADTFSDLMGELASAGGCILGGCCGTTPEYIKKTVEKTKDIPYRLPNGGKKTVVTSYSKAVTIGNEPILIGERINPTGKPKLKGALRSADYSYIANEAIKQTDMGAHILDVNVGLPEIDEYMVMERAVETVQAVSELPLCIDSTRAEVLEKALRRYNGKALINSVNGERSSMERVFPLTKKYGGAIIALTMDENGIPKSAQERAEIAKRIAESAKGYGIDENELIFDPLALTVSSDPDSAKVTLEAIRLIKEMGYHTSLGVSNISFGLPRRDIINAVFFAQALERGLDCAIMNPFAEGMMNAYYAHRALHGQDRACSDYIEYANGAALTDVKPKESTATLYDAVISGVKASAITCAKDMLNDIEPLDIINGHIIPALNEIGNRFERKTAFLPQLLYAAEAATAAIDEVKPFIKKNADSDNAVILATVKGDIHDIGKNIVKVMLESYGFKIIDLGKDVEPSKIVDAVNESSCKVVGLSALMTTTVPAMEETIKLLKANDPEIFTIVGGAVLNQEYADMIGADSYCKDAMEAVRVVKGYYKT